MEVDRLSSLPDHLIHHILSFVDTKNVILLGVLSSRWRYLSTSVPNLHFNYSLNFDDEGYFVRFVDRALLVNSSPNIHKFRLSWLPYNKEYVSHVDAWLRFAMRRGIQQLDFSFPCMNDSYELPSWLLNCETLVSLTLWNCWIGVSKLVNFTNLTVLYLDYVKLRVGFVEDLLKGCPQLEELTICSSFFVPVKICTSSSLQLKRLKIKGAYTLRVNIEAPNLQILKFSSGTFGKFSFKAMPFLREAEVSIFYDPDMRKKCISSLKSSILNLRNARVLKICSTCIQAMPIPTFEDLHSCFFKTKVLVLRTGVQKFEMPGIANLLWSSPDLENLIIDLGRYSCIYVYIDYIEEKTQLNVSIIKLIYNACQRQRVAERAGRSHIQQLFAMLMQHEYIEWHRKCDGTDTVLDLFWTHPTSLDLLRAFPHKIMHTSVYKHVCGTKSSLQNY